MTYVREMRYKNFLEKKILIIQNCFEQKFARTHARITF